MLAFTGAPAEASDHVLRVGVQKYGTLVILRERQTLEPELKRLGWSVRWTEFPGGPQLLEALNVGDLDFGITGEAPPVFAQAAGAPLVYVAAEPPAPHGEAILVPHDSPLKTLGDLKGKHVALNKGSNVHFLLVQALQSVGLKPADIQPVYLAPADARAAFEQGAVDAWVIWDPGLMLLDEPLGALDALTRGDMQRLSERIWRESGFTAVLVTHDVAEAVALSDRIVALRGGRIVRDIAVPLPRPRPRASAEAGALEATILDALFEWPARPIRETR